MHIRIDPHTLVRAQERGASEDEIFAVLGSGCDIVAKYGRLGRQSVFVFDQIRNGKYYAQKLIQVYYLIENGEMVTVTVYVFYGKWEV